MSPVGLIVMHLSAMMMGLMTLAIILFSREFLQTAQHLPRLDRVFKLMAVVMSVITVLGVFRSYGEIVIWIAAAAIILPPLLLSTGVVIYKKGFDSARFYIIGWGSFLIGSALFAMNKLAWIGGYDFFAYAQQVGSALQMLFLSWALADYQRQSEKEYVQKLNGLYQILKEQVDASLTQVRQNDQVLIEKSRLAAMGEMIEQIAHQWRQPLNSLSLINQNLYFKVQLGTASKKDYIDAHDKANEQLQYMSQTIDDFRNFSQPIRKKRLS
jgi:signal transduction histidine kinase